MPTRNQIKVRENKVRRVAAREGLIFKKSGRRDLRAPDYNKWLLSHVDGTAFVSGKSGYCLQLEEVEDLLGVTPPKYRH